MLIADISKIYDIANQQFTIQAHSVATSASTTRVLLKTDSEK